MDSIILVSNSRIDSQAKYQYWGFWHMHIAKPIRNIIPMCLVVTNTCKNNKHSRIRPMRILMNARSLISCWIHQRGGFLGSCKNDSDEGYGTHAQHYPQKPSAESFSTYWDSFTLGSTGVPPLPNHQGVHRVLCENSENLQRNMFIRG